MKAGVCGLWRMKRNNELKQLYEGDWNINLDQNKEDRLTKKVDRENNV